MPRNLDRRIEAVTPIDEPAAPAGAARPAAAHVAGQPPGVGATARRELRAAHAGRSEPERGTPSDSRGTPAVERRDQPEDQYGSPADSANFLSSSCCSGVRSVGHGHLHRHQLVAPPPFFSTPCPLMRNRRPGCVPPGMLEHHPLAVDGADAQPGAQRGLGQVESVTSQTMSRPSRWKNRSGEHLEGDQRDRRAERRAAPAGPGPGAAPACRFRCRPAR